MLATPIGGEQKKYTQMNSNSEQNEGLNTLGFVTSQLRRSLVIGVIAIILGAWYFSNESLTKDKENCYTENDLLRKKLYEEVADHMADLKRESEYRKDIERRQLELDFQRRKVQSELNQLK